LIQMNLETLIRQAKPDYIHADSEKATSAILDRLQELPQMQSRKISVRIALVAAAIAVMMSALVANAASGGKLFGAILLNKENRHIAKEPNYASMQAVPSGTEIAPFEKPILNSNIINENQLQTINASTVTNIAVTGSHGQYPIPELLTGNGDLVIFTKTDDSGWYLNKGEQLTIRYTLDLKTNKQSDQAGEYMEIGYIKNGELLTGFFKRPRSFHTPLQQMKQENIISMLRIFLLALL
jgi:hypothetical protein